MTQKKVNQELTLGTDFQETINLSVGNDNGNSEHDIVIDGVLIQQPNVFSKVNKLPNMDEVDPLKIARDIHNNLIIDIISSRLNNGMPTTYYIGNYAINSGKRINNIEIGVDNDKLNNDIPLVNTLGQIAGYSVAKAFIQNNNIEELNINVDMTTALPVSQYNKKNGLQFSEKFIGKHKVNVHLGSIIVYTTINFAFVKTIPEAVPAVFYLQTEPNEEVFKEYKKDYEIKSLDFENKKIIHVAIGEGTTEYPITEDIEFNMEHIKGSNNGIGIAIENILEGFRKDYDLPNYSRQDYSKALRDQNNKYHTETLEDIQEQLEYQSEEIFRNIKEEIRSVNNDIDIICVYGGGSILMKQYLKERIMNFTNNKKIQLLYIDEPYAVGIEALGMYQFTKSEIFIDLKKEYESK